MALNLAYKIKKEEHFPATVSNMSRLKVIETIKQKLSGVQLKMFEASCFGHFLKMEDIQFSGKIVHSLLLRQLKDQPSNELWFGIGEGNAERVAKFTFAEWCLITGLSNFREVPKFDIVGFGKMEEILNGQTDITNAELETIFINAQSDDDELMVKLACLYFLECTLLGKERKTRIKREHIRMVEEFEKFNKFPWGKVSYEMTVEKMQKIMEGREKKKSKSTKKNPNNEQKYDVCGFALAFQVWAYEAIPLIGATCAKKVQEAFPRILSWKSSEAPSLKQLNDKIFARKSTLTVLKHLRPRTKELEFEYTLWCFGSQERKTQASKKLVNEENTAEQLGDSSRTESDEVEGVTPSIKDARDNKGATETSKSEEKPEPIKKKTMSDDAGYHSSISLSCAKPGSYEFCATTSTSERRESSL